MNDSHFRLTLYFGYVNAPRVGEGGFEGTDLHAIQRRSAAQQAIDQQMGYVHLGTTCYVRTPQEAEEIVRWAQANVSNAQGIFLLKDAQHGVVRFFRAIRFEGWQPNQKPELVQRCMQSGHTLIGNDEMYLRMAARDNGQTPIDKDIQAIMARRSYAPPQQRTLWEQALEFHE